MEGNIDYKNWHLAFQILFFSEYVQGLLIMFVPFIIELFMLIVISIPLEFIQLLNILEVNPKFVSLYYQQILKQFIILIRFLLIFMDELKLKLCMLEVQFHFDKFYEHIDQIFLKLNVLLP